jgi:hypothetical protein
MKDAATNQTHHGMRAEDMLFADTIRDAHYRRDLCRTGEETSPSVAQLTTALCASDHPHRESNLSRREHSESPQAKS